MDAAGLKPIKDESDPIFSLPEGVEAAEWDNLLWQGWRAFNARERPGWIRASIVSSWQRSRQRGIDPDDFVYCAPPADALAAILAANADLIAVARTSSRSHSTVLLRGESGTGKELFAQAIHNASARSGEPFVAVNCGALPRDLVQSELFGYVDGAFTGSSRGGSAGKFELADGGTLLLDEIGEMPLEAQTSLLRVLQENEVLRIGAAQPVKVDVRIVAATHCDLALARQRARAGKSGGADGQSVRGTAH